MPFLAYLLFVSCAQSNQIQAIQYIKVNLEEKASKGNFDEYFSSSKVIALETNDQSFLSKIDRLSLYEDKIFILDRKLDAVFVFNNEGVFLNKIQNVGRGPQEYNSLMDFTIDKKNRHLILYTDRPYRLFIYNFEGEFVETKEMDNLYLNIASLNDNILLLNKQAKNKYMLFEQKIKSKNKKSFLPVDKKDIFFENYGIGTPNITKSKNIYISFPYSETIYEYGINGVNPRYYIDFGNNKMPDKVYDLEKDLNGVFDYAKNNNYGWGITNFRETENHITFSYHLTKLVIYSKKNKSSKMFSLFIDKEIPFFSYFAHDGNDNRLIAIQPASAFKKQMDIYIKEEEPWKKIPERIKQLAKTTSESDNPLLIIYSFKENID